MTIWYPSSTLSSQKKSWWHFTSLTFYDYSHFTLLLKRLSHSERFVHFTRTFYHSALSHTCLCLATASLETRWQRYCQHYDDVYDGAVPFREFIKVLIAYIWAGRVVWSWVDDDASFGTLEKKKRWQKKAVRSSIFFHAPFFSVPAHSSQRHKPYLHSSFVQSSTHDMWHGSAVAILLLFCVHRDEKRVEWKRRQLNHSLLVLCELISLLFNGNCSMRQTRNDEWGICDD